MSKDQEIVAAFTWTLFHLGLHNWTTTDIAFLTVKMIPYAKNS